MATHGSRRGHRAHKRHGKRSTLMALSWLASARLGQEFLLYVGTRPRAATPAKPQRETPCAGWGAGPHVATLTRNESCAQAERA